MDFRRCSPAPKPDSKLVSTSPDTKECPRSTPSSHISLGLGGYGKSPLFHWVVMVDEEFGSSAAAVELFMVCAVIVAPKAAMKNPMKKGYKIRVIRRCFIFVLVLQR